VARTTPPPSSTSTRPKPIVVVPAPVKGVALPLGYSTGTATRVITVVSSSYSHTTATLQAWNKAPGGGGLKYGPAITAHIGSQGMTTSPSESKSATPVGSFSLTQAFGHLANPGSGLPYFQTTPSDWWISQSGSLYNTHEHCSSNCSFSQGSPNEHLYYETPFYNYAVVIDYNTRNAPGGVKQGAGSAFFLHVTDGNPTAGCVAIPSSNLVTIMRWLAPSTHPRILIGVT
jgi:L,D-peptidoglycan transpeptidase YkuD (ErfK/YbiS/YcfS/YnhG family)